MKIMLLSFPLLTCASLLATLCCYTADAASSRSSVGIGPYFKGPLGLQLYSLRDAFKNDVPGTMAKVREYGFKNVELAGTYSLSPGAFATLLKDNGLNAISGHFPYETFRDQVESVVRDAKVLGLKYAGCAWIPHEGNFDEKQCREATAVFNRAGEALAKNGIKFFYHVHGYEFQPFGDGTLLDLMMQQTNSKFVSYEMDIFWIVFPNQQPVEWLLKYGKRWELMHLKDMKKGTQTGALTGNTDVTNDVPLGEGMIELPSLLSCAKRIGVKYYFIEDESPTAAQNIPVSLRYLHTVEF